jgi:PKHD-type hydroxylase
MIMVIADIIPRDQVAALRARILALQFQDGGATAGWHAKLVKKNLQADRSDPAYAALNKQVTELITTNTIFRMAVRPKSMTPLLFSRYLDSMTYGAHVDDATLMGLRSDVSFTLALADPNDYDGGELVMETTAGDQGFKLQPGHMIIYPSTTLHRVEPVTRGERVSAVGWIQSQVRDAHKREILYDIEIARRGIFDQQGKTREFDLMSKASANLLRLWTDA